MRGMAGGWCPAGTGVVEPRAVDGVAGDRPGGVWPILASRCASTIATKYVAPNAGKRWKAFRSEDDDDATMPYKRCAASKTMPATAQWYASRVGFLSGCAIRAMCLYTSRHTALS